MFLMILRYVEVFEVFLQVLFLLNLILETHFQNKLGPFGPGPACLLYLSDGLGPGQFVRPSG